MAAVASAPPDQAHYGNLQHTALSAFWFGMNFLWIPLTTVLIPGLLILMAANNYPEIVIGYAIIQFFFNAAGAAYAGIIPDVVPAQQVGKASGFLATMTQLGIGGGLGVTSLMSHNRAIYLVMGVVAALCLIPTVWAARTEGMEPIEPPPQRPFAETLREFL